VRTLEGGCHCGRVRFRVSADLDRVTECNCSVCTKKGYLHLIVPCERFVLLAGEAELTTYRFNTGVAQHRFCRTCGVQGFYVPRSDPDKIDVNVRCLDDVDLSGIAVHPFDGKNWEKAMTKKVPWRGTGRAPVLVLAYAGCSTCKNAIRWLDGRRVGYTLRPIVEEPPTEAELARWIPASAIGVRKWLNTSGQSYRALGKAKVDAASDAQIVRLLARDGKLVRRPVVVWGKDDVTVGFKEDAYAARAARGVAAEP
jgi:Spx/MgsR family transcriptional regulator